MAEAKLKARAEMETAPFMGGLDKMTKGVKTFSSTGLQGVAREIGKAFAVERIAAWGHEQLKAAAALVNLAESVGLTTDALQGLYSAGRNTSTNIKTIDLATSNLANSQDKVVNGDKAMIAAFQRLGISAEEVASMGLQELFDGIAKGSQTSATAINDMTEIFGSGMGVKMMPLMKEIADDGFQGMIDKAKDLGEVVSAVDLMEMSKAADDIQHAFKQAGTWLVDKLMYAFNFVKNIAAILGAMSGGASLTDAIEMAARGEIGAGADQNAIAKKIEDEEAQRELARTQKVEQQKANIKKEAEEKYQKELAKMLEDAAEEAAKNTEKIDAQAAKRKLDAHKAAQHELAKAQKEKWRKDDRDEAIAKLLAEKRTDISVGGVQSADQYSRFGLFSGGQVNNASRMILERQLKVAEEVRNLSAKILDIQKDFAKDAKRTAEAITGG